MVRCATKFIRGNSTAFAFIDFFHILIQLIQTKVKLKRGSKLCKRALAYAKCSVWLHGLPVRRRDSPVRLKVSVRIRPGRRVPHNRRYERQCFLAVLPVRPESSIGQLPQCPCHHWRPAQAKRVSVWTCCPHRCRRFRWNAFAHV